MWRAPSAVAVAVAAVAVAVAAVAAEACSTIHMGSTYSRCGGKVGVKPFQVVVACGSRSSQQLPRSFQVVVECD